MSNPSDYDKWERFEKIKEYPEDVKAIQRAASGAGFPLTPQQAAAAWLAYSDTVCAGWISVARSHPDWIVDCLRRVMPGSGDPHDMLPCGHPVSCDPTRGDSPRGTPYCTMCGKVLGPD